MTQGTVRTTLLAFTIAICGQLLFVQAAYSQGEPSAFIDPFNPTKTGSDRSVSDQPAKGNSFFPKLPVPKMPKLPRMPKLPNLNPFSKKQSPQAAAAPKKPNMFQQFGNGTKNFFTKTTHTLMPWTKPKPKHANGAIVPAFMQQEKTAGKKKSGIQLMNFFQSSQPDKKVETTSDFFRQERPGFRK